MAFFESTNQRFTRQIALQIATAFNRQHSRAILFRQRNRCTVQRIHNGNMLRIDVQHQLAASAAVPIDHIACAATFEDECAHAIVALGGTLDLVLRHKLVLAFLVDQQNVFLLRTF